MNTEQYLPKGTAVRCGSIDEIKELISFWHSKRLINDAGTYELEIDFQRGYDSIRYDSDGLVWNTKSADPKYTTINYADYKAQYMTTAPTDFNPIEPHYYKTDLTDFIEQHELNFQRGNALKYIVRAGKKDSSKEIEDLQKAIWYIQKEIQFVKSRNQNS